MSEKYYKKYLKYKHKYALLKNEIYAQYGGNPPPTVIDPSKNLAYDTNMPGAPPTAAQAAAIAASNKPPVLRASPSSQVPTVSRGPQ